jgi:Ca2+-binding RTX toxin-like protein
MARRVKRIGTLGNDTFYATNRAEVFFGYSSIDVVSYAGSRTGVEVNLSNGRGRFGDAHNDVYWNIETIVGSRHADRMAGNNAANSLHGGDGNDSLYGNGGQDWLPGGSGDDRLFGGHGSDVLEGMNGHDSIHGDIGHDLLSGHEGSDTLNGGHGYDTLYGGEGADTFVFTRNESMGFSKDQDTIKDFNSIEDKIQFDGPEIHNYVIIWNQPGYVAIETLFQVIHIYGYRKTTFDWEHSVKTGDIGRIIQENIFPL